MKQEGLSFFTDTYLTILGLVIFFLFFIGVVVWVNRKNVRDYYKSMQSMPLNDGELSYERK
jgi:cbb3-type cytochrome oxidase subunit 3